MREPRSFRIKRELYDGTSGHRSFITFQLAVQPFRTSSPTQDRPSLFSNVAQYWIALWQNHLTLARLYPRPV